MKKVIHEAVTERWDFLDRHGRITDENYQVPAAETLIEMYKGMVLIRSFDEKALNLQRQGRMGTYSSLRGQEAAQIGLALAMRKDDWFIPSFREHGIMITLGIPMHLIYAYWRGDERGNEFPEGINCLPISVPVGSQYLHAVGIGMGLKLQQSDRIAIGCGGEGSTSEGDFHEAMNFAGIFRTRTLFFIQNNQWAISVPMHRQVAAESVAQRAWAYGFPGLQVDGNDILAVYEACRSTIQRIRQGEGPFLIEALTFRMGDHTTADDQRRYRDQKLVKFWQERDPIVRLESFLLREGVVSQNEVEDIAAWTREQVEAEVQILEAMPPREPTEIFDYLYNEPPETLLQQRRLFAALHSEQEVSHGTE